MCFQTQQLFKEVTDTAHTRWLELFPPPSHFSEEGVRCIWQLSQTPKETGGALCCHVIWRGLWFFHLWCDNTMAWNHPIIHSSVLLARYTEILFLLTSFVLKLTTSCQSGVTIWQPVKCARAMVLLIVRRQKLVYVLCHRLLCCTPVS